MNKPHLNCLTSAVLVYLSTLSVGAHAETAGASAADASAGTLAAAAGEVVIIATKRELSQQQLTQASSVVGADEILAQAQTSVTDTLRTLPSMQFSVGGAPGQFVYSRLRGFSDSTLYAFDGITLNTGGSGGIGYLLGQIDPTMVQRIEVLRGPHATTYGANTTSGVIAMTSLEGRQRQADVSLEAGSLGWKKGRVGVQDSMAVGDGGIWKYALNGSYLDSDGVNPDEYTRNGTLVARTSYAVGDIEVGGSLYYTANKFQSATLIESIQGAPAPFYSIQIPNPANVDKTKASIFSLWIDQQLDANWSQKLTLGGDKQDFKIVNGTVGSDNLLGHYTAPYDGWTDPSTYSTYDAGDVIAVYQSPYTYATDDRNLQADYNLRYQSKTVSAVMGATYLKQKSTERYDSQAYGSSGSDEQQTTASLYGNVSLGWLDNTLRTDIGARLDDYTAWRNKGTWSAGLNWEPIKGTQLYANYGTSFTQPTLDQLYSPLYGSKAITPENARTIEAGLRTRLAEDKLTLGLTFWHSKVDNVITFDYSIPNDRCGYTDYCGVYANKNAERSQGVETELAWKILPQLTLSANHTYTDAQLNSGGVWSDMTGTSKHTANLGLTWAQQAFDVGVNAYHADRRLRWAGDFYAPGYTRVDIFGRWHATQALDIYGRVQNLFDRHIVEQLGYRNPGIYAVAGLRYTFH